MDPKKIEFNRNFANKLWNSARFILGNLKDVSADEWDALAVTQPMSDAEIAKLPLPERSVIRTATVGIAN